MKKSFKTTLVLLTILISLAFTSDEKQPNKAIYKNYITNTINFESSLTTLLESIKNKNLEASKQNFQKARLAYKKIEHILAHIDPHLTDLHINGAPLPKVEQNVGNMAILNPSGLQTIDELLHEENTDWKKISDLTKKVKTHISTNINYQKSYQLQDRNIFEAARNGFIRLATLGISGFDKPASHEHYKEWKGVLESIHEDMSYYDTAVEQKDKALQKEKVKLFEEAINYLDKNKDFETFDRFNFTQNYLNPLIDIAYRYQTTLNIETINLVTPLKQPVHYSSTNIFAENFLNEDYYTINGGYKEKEKIRQLGKILFFDPVLSGNNKRACASCHNPEKGFADGNDKSLAFDFKGEIGRNAPTILNTGYSNKFFHDMRANRLESQPTHVVVNPNEFNTSYDEMTMKLNKSGEYKRLFTEAFPELNSYKINKQTINIALASYMRSLKSFNSPFDKAIRGEQKTSKEVIKGYNLFMGKAACGTCHFPPTFAGLVPPYYKDMEAEVIGVPGKIIDGKPIKDEDLGKYNSGRAIDQHEIFSGAFKTASVRNIELTAPYMHNGIFESLEEVVDFYNDGGGAGQGLDIPHQTLPFDELVLTDVEKASIVEFMKALTDTTNLTSKPTVLPAFEDSIQWNSRKVGGEY